MQVKKIAAVLAIASLSAGAAMADSITDSGLVLSAPTYNVATSTVSRTDVQTQAREAVRENISDTIAAAGLRHDDAGLTAQRSRDAVRAEALQASRKAYASSAQLNAGQV